MIKDGIKFVENINIGVETIDQIENIGTERIENIGFVEQILFATNSDTKALELRLDDHSELVILI